MKKSYSLLLVFVLSCGLSSALQAQELESGYFLGGNPYAFRMNPAFQSERNVFSIALGQTGLGMWSNLGVSTLLYPDNGKVYTFLNDRVSAADFMRKIGKRNSINLDARVNLLTLGFWADQRFFTLDFNVRSLNAVSAPYDLFSFLKEGSQSRNTFDFSGMGVRSKEFIEAAFGWSKNYENRFNVGFRVKGLVGIAEAEVLVQTLKLTMTNERWEVLSKSVLNASSPSLAYTKNGNELDVSSIHLDDSHIGPAGFGGAVDLGASWNVLPQLTLSAAVLDLGAIRWNREIRGLSPESSYAWVPSEQEASGQEGWNAEIDRAASALSGIIRFQDVSGSGTHLEMLPFRVNAGAEFRMPFYELLTVGALYQGRGGTCYARHTGRFSLNWNPLDFLSMSTSTTLSGIAESIGFVLNLHPAAFNLLIGCDYIPFHCVNISPLLQDIPAQYQSLAVLPRDRMNLNLYIGFNMSVGRCRLDHKKRFMW